MNDHIVPPIVNFISKDRSVTDILNEERKLREKNSQIIEFKNLKTLGKIPHEGIYIKITPDKCKIWKFANRPEDEMGDIEGLRESMNDSGQAEPILLRPINKNDIVDDKIELEVIFGNRRHRAASKIPGFHLSAIIKDIDLDTALLLQQAENDKRQDISDYAQALHYKHLIDTGIYKTVNQIATIIKKPRKSVHNIMAYTRIPNEVLNAIDKKNKLSQSMAIKIAALVNDESNISKILLLTDAINSSKINTPQKLEDALQIKSKTTRIIEKKTFFSSTGEKIFTLRRDANGSPTFIIHKAVREIIDIDALSNQIKDVIEKNISHVKHNIERKNMIKEKEEVS